MTRITKNGGGIKRSRFIGSTQAGQVSDVLAQFWLCQFISCYQGSDRPGKLGKLRELENASEKSEKIWKNNGILFEANYFYFFQILIGVTHTLSSLCDHFVIFVLIACILIFIMKLPLYLNDFSWYSHKEIMV